MDNSSEVSDPQNHSTALETEDDDRSSVTSSLFEPEPDLVTAYESLLKRQFDDQPTTWLIPTHPVRDDASEGDVDDGTEEGRPMTKAEKQNAKKKRRRERGRLARLATDQKTETEDRGQRGSTVGFRLFSSCPIRPVTLAIVAETYPLPPNPRHEGFTKDEVQRRRTMAESAAVEYSDLGGPSTYASKWTRSDRPARILARDDPDNQPGRQNWLIGSIGQDDDTHRSRVVRLKEVDGRVRKKIRRGRTSKVKDRPAPAYWKPAGKGDLGGKSMSTVWGYGLGMGVK